MGRSINEVEDNEKTKNDNNKVTVDESKIIYSGEILRENKVLVERVIPYTNAGIKGEYWILGQDYSGKVVHNEVFPTPAYPIIFITLNPFTL
mgnify:CR=1 FL=1